MYGLNSLATSVKLLASYGISLLSSSSSPSTGQDSIIYSAHMLKKLKRLHHLFGSVWYDVSPHASAVSEGAVSDEVKAEIGKEKIRRFASIHSTPSSQGDRIVIMSYETRFLVTSSLYLQEFINENTGIEVDLRWLADVRNLAFILVSIVIALIAIFGFSWISALMEGGSLKRVKRFYN